MSKTLMTAGPLFPGFERVAMAVADEVTINAVVGGSGPPLLLLHGHPQTHAMWHKVAPALAEHFTVVASDLRGYGDSSKPRGDAAHHAYSKRTMARDQVELMKQLGFPSFDLLTHDRGSRVAHRLAIDHAATLGRVVILDIAPTLAMYRATTEEFARAYWHWFFLIQAGPLPERLIAADPAAYVAEIMGSRGAGLAPFDPRALAEYQRCAALPGAAHAMCEDYRASASVDLEIDQADIDAGRMIEAPLMVLWGEHGVIERCFDPLALWRRLARDVRGSALPCGHYVAEEVPAQLLEQALPFLTGER